jgi:hypothetical protein
MKLVGFLILLAVVFVAAHAAGARFGPVTTSHSRVQYTGGSSGGPGMNMNMNMNMNKGGTSTGGTNMSGMNMSGTP